MYPDSRWWSSRLLLMMLFFSEWWGAFILTYFIESFGWSINNLHILRWLRAFLAQRWWSLIWLFNLFCILVFHQFIKLQFPFNAVNRRSCRICKIFWPLARRDLWTMSLTATIRLFVLQLGLGLLTRRWEIATGATQLILIFDHHIIVLGGVLHGSFDDRPIHFCALPAFNRTAYLFEKSFAQKLALSEKLDTAIILIPWCRMNRSLSIGQGLTVLPKLWINGTQLKM
jgi:hypothetical protein